MFKTNKFYLIQLTVALCCLYNSNCVTHWKLNDGTIEAISSSIYTLQRPYDLISFVKQDERAQRLTEIKNILSSRDIISKRDPKEMPIVSLQDNFYKHDADCIKAGQPLAKFSFFDNNFVSWKDHISKSSEDEKAVETHFEVNGNVELNEPYCKVDLPFSMRIFSHLESIQAKQNTTMQPDSDLNSRLRIDSNEIFGLFVSTSLEKNSSSWIYLWMASDYFRIKGDFANAIDCLQKSLFYVHTSYRGGPSIALAHLLHKQNFMNDSLAIALSSLTYEPANSLLSYFIGNIYMTLGELSMAFEWYDRAIKIDPSLTQASNKRHAVLCHQKLEKFLEEQQSLLKKKLEELKDYQALSDEWGQLNTKVNSETSSIQRKEHTKHAYEQLLSSLKCKLCDWALNPVSKTNTILCRNETIYCPDYSLVDSNDAKVYQVLEANNERIDLEPLEFFFTDDAYQSSKDKRTELNQMDKFLTEKQVTHIFEAPNPPVFKQKKCP